MWPKTSAFSPPDPESRPKGLPPKPPVKVEYAQTRNVGHDERIIGVDELESWYNALNDLHSTRTGSRIPATTSEAIADVRDSIYGHLR
jgi:hypothetical protein